MKKLLLLIVFKVLEVAVFLAVCYVISLFVRYTIGDWLYKIFDNMSDVWKISIFLLWVLSLALWVYADFKRWINLNKKWVDKILDRKPYDINRFKQIAKGVGIENAAIEKIVNSILNSASELGLTNRERDDTFLAVEQMLLRGVVTTIELRKQLGEQLPGSISIMANAIGVPIAELDRMMKAGELSSVDALPKFFDALEKAYGISKQNK